MLQITIPESEFYDTTTQKFYTVKAVSLTLEHSLLSLSKWESKWHKPFISKEKKTREELLDYISCMLICKPSRFSPKTLTEAQFSEITKYIDEPMTATKFSNRPGGSSREIVTNEIIYHWMIAYQIPFECQKWHLNRLLTLIKVCSIKNAPPGKKMGRQALISRNASLNAQRKQTLNTNG